jgi:hypothetical protein
MKQLYTLLLLILLGGATAHAQEAASAKVTGLVKDAISDQPIDLATVYIEGTNRAVETSSTGRYSIVVPTEAPFVLIFTRLGYQEVRAEISAMPARTSRQVDVAMPPVNSDVEVIVRSSKIEEAGMIREDVDAAQAHAHHHRATWRAYCPTSP